MTNSARFKTNHDSLSAQQKEFTKSGALLRNVFGISTKHPFLSVLFALAFGVMVNALYDLISYPFLSDKVEKSTILVYAVMIGALFLVCNAIIARLKVLHSDLFVATPLSQKKLLVTLVSKGRNDYQDTPSYNTLYSLLYSDDGQAATNALEKVVLVTTELPEVTVTANDLKSHIEAGNREAELYGISINNRSLLEIQQQMDVMLKKMVDSYNPHEIIVDYTGGNKDMSIALFRASEKALITPIYLNSATDGQHSKY